MTTAAQKPSRSATGSRRSRTAARPQRRIARMRREYFVAAGDLARRYGVRFERVVEHLWHARARSPRFLLRSVTCLEDLVHAIACIDNHGLAWSDLHEQHERTLVRRCREGRDETETTVIVRRFIAELRRSALNGRCALAGYAGNRPLRNWLADELNHGLRRRQRAAFTLDPGDTACPALLFEPSSGTGW